MAVRFLGLVLVAWLFLCDWCCSKFLQIGLQQHQQQHLLLSGLWNCRFFTRLHQPEHLQNSERLDYCSLKGRPYGVFKRKQACQDRMQTAVGSQNNKIHTNKEKTAVAPTIFCSTLLFIGKLSPATTCAIVPPNVMAPSNSLHAKRFTNVR